MNDYLGWPNIVVGVILILGALRGYANGLLAELGGIVAIVAAFAAAIYYNGMLDTEFEHALRMNPGEAHLTGVVVTGLVVYGVIVLFLRLISRPLKLPVLRLANAICGAAVGFAKGAILLWVVLFVALLFPLSHQVRGDLQRSTLVTILARQNKRADEAIYAKLPSFMQPYVEPILKRQQLESPAP